ncbi:hypothetical protein P175DRAFT_0557946 [Aspergillus ochraceoroseus IBT 24754]|uniref:C2H2-type domain-containing protein n=1 Tax=Aspergillus ochraceoroseus IBT 24754 TaxID=1392256 RepID=A0A2T5LYB6_9EURO|nr:uncharacterized protein P175DRAFT_0557946 [Aspergillus ochraceoroseus IBT 24754]PTU21288.1 hypothetical protein P175DRAFT_0557946 [Aspergillus ochraceoroseus IBT 24754]
MSPCKDAPEERRFEYNWIDSAENLEKYKPGGYHPIMIGDLLIESELEDASSQGLYTAIMPWKAQVCPFCQTRYANKQGLINHLLKYTGELRIPADGIHDVLGIQRLSIMKRHFPAEEVSYRCPSCLKAISGQRRFTDHVIYRGHYRHSENHEEKSSRFDPEPFKIWRPRGTFPLFRLPPVWRRGHKTELRQMVYRAVLCFQSVRFSGCVQKYSVDPVNGLRLQYNPSRNLLALLAVSRQVYHEARRVFYRYNTFVFESKPLLPIFLIGIGKANTLLLQSVEWVSDSGLYENHIAVLKSFITRRDADVPGLTDVSIWNDEDHFLEFMRIMKFPDPVYRPSTDRLLRLDADDVSERDGYYRYSLSVRCSENGRKQNGKAVYELRTRRMRDDDPHLLGVARIGLKAFLIYKSSMQNYSAGWYAKGLYFRLQADIAPV